MPKPNGSDQAEAVIQRIEATVSNWASSRQSAVIACALRHCYFDATTAGGFHVPSPGGKIDGGVSLGQYRRITR